MIIILDNLRSALNVGSIIRTCDALGIREVYLCGITPGIDNPKVKKTSLGAEQSVKTHSAASTIEAVKDLKAKGYQILPLELTPDAEDVSKFSPSGDVVLVIGNEVSGVSSDVIEISDSVVMIPMQGTKESLNVSVAFGIAAYSLGHKKGVVALIPEL
jgi:23S rRNA (guanosine2251-2'-O)-methyltransferase